MPRSQERKIPLGVEPTRLALDHQEAVLEAVLDQIGRQQHADIAEQLAAGSQEAHQRIGIHDLIVAIRHDHTRNPPGAGPPARAQWCRQR